MSIDLGHSGRTKDCLVASLHYLELGCSDPEEMGAFYHRALAYNLTDESQAVVASGPDRRLVFLPGQPKTLISAGFAVPDADELTRLRDRIRLANWPSQDGATRFFTDSVTVRDPDGNCLSFGLADGGGEHDSGPQARLQHVVVASRNPVEIVRFFIDVLGFTLSDDVLDQEGGVRTSFLRSNQEHHSFAVFKAAENRLDHHCYETASWNDIRDWADHMSAEHIALQWGPGRHGPGNNLFIFVHDPDGNWVELSAELEIVEHDRPAGQWPHVQRTLNSWGVGMLRS
ncbi:VOC family protein [Novosphingobium resinovorum]|uniref:VOC family protein n=1 Tax=Novosphingobium resinovorum TaxID=158500 RepID=UPI002ED17C9F|nr:VOC family protein [Novosphingobium resinovorum]